jgi:FtsH-binding integral membrane protein
MSGNGPALLAAAAGVAIGHAILPDHWVPLAVVGRTRRYPLSRVARLSGLAGIAHVLVSLALGAIVIAVGLQFRSTIQSAQEAIVGGLLIVTGLGFAVLELTGRGHHHGPGHEHHHDHDHDHDHAHTPTAAKRSSGLAAVMIPFGAAASPDLTILPVFLAAATAGIGIAIGSLVIFAAVTIGTIVGLTVAATRGGYELKGNWLEQWGNAFTALVLVIIGVLVLAGII